MLFSDGSSVDFFVRWGRSSEASTSAWDVMLWDTGVWDGASEIGWTDVQNDVLSVDTKHGKDAFNKRFRTGTAKVVLSNDDGQFSGKDSPMSPGDHVEVFAVITAVPSDLPKPIPDGTTWADQTTRLWTSNGNLILDEPSTGVVGQWLFTGRVDSKIETTFRGDDTVTVRCVDRFAEYASIDFDAGAPVGAGEDTRDRLNRILTNAGLATIQTRNEIDEPQFFMAATDLAKPMLNELYLTSESEGGDIWMNQKGEITVGYRDWLTKGFRQVSVTAVLGDNVGLGITTGKPAQDLQLVVNDATISNAGGTQQTSVDAGSVARYGRRTFRRNDLVGNSDTQSLFLANRITNQLSQSRPRVRNVTVQIDAESLSFASELLTGDLVMVTIRSIHGHSETFLSHVIGFTQSVFEGEWNIGLTLDDAFIVVGEGGGFDNEAFSTGYNLGQTGG